MDVCICNVAYLNDTISWDVIKLDYEKEKLGFDFVS